MTKGLTLRFTLPLPDKFAPIQVSLSIDRDLKPDEKEEEFIINLGREIVNDMRVVAKSLVAEVLDEERKIMDELAED